MIRRYSRPRHFTAGWSRPRESVATNCNGLTTAPSPPVSVRLPHRRCCGFARGIGEVHDLIGRAHQQAVALDKAADRGHVPDVILVGVHRALGGHHVERGDADVPQRFDGPAVVAIRLAKRSARSSRTL